MEHTTLDLEKKGLVCLASQGNWGFFLDNNVWQCFTWNFKYNEKIQLPRIPRSVKLLKYVMTCSMTHRLHANYQNEQLKLNDYLCSVFVFLKKGLFFLVCRPPLYAQWEIIAFSKSWTRALCDAVAFLNGKCIYTLSTDGKLGIIEDVPHIRMRAPFSSKAPTNSIAMYRRRQLVSCENQLFLVQQKLGSPSVMEVWNVNLKTGQFKRIFNLKGIYIFLSRGHSSADYAPVEGNCVYFTEDGNDHCSISKRNELYAFDFKDQSMFVVKPKENISVHIPYNSVPSLMFKPQQNGGDNSKNESDELTHVNCHNTKEQIVEPHNICAKLSVDLQRKISQYLLTQDVHAYMNFRSVSKIWKSLAPCLRWKVDVNTPSGSLQDCVWLLTINQEDGLCTLYNPFTNLTCCMNNNDLLVGCDIRYSKDGVLLVSRGPRSLFFVELFSNRMIQLPEQTEDYCCDTMSFSDSPFNSSNWMIFGIVSVDEYQVRISYLRAGDYRWISSIMNNKVPFLLSCSRPVCFGGRFCVIGQDGNLGVFGFVNVYCYWSIKRIAQQYEPHLFPVVCRHFLVQCEQNLLYSVIVGGQRREYVRVYKLDFPQCFTVQLVKEVKTRLIFISEASSFFMPNTELAGFNDAVLFPKFSSNGDYIHYSLKDDTYRAGKEECNDICLRKELLGRVWIHNKYLARHVL